MSSDHSGSKAASLRARVKKGEKFPYRIMRRAYCGIHALDLPVPRGMCVVLWNAVSLIVRGYYWVKATFWVSPLYKGLCSTVGERFRPGTFVPYVEGRGEIHLGNNVRFYGKQTFIFASIRHEIPAVLIGDSTRLGHNVVFDIAGTLVIGKGCLVASGVTFVDCGGHSIVPELREAGVPPTIKDIREITIGNNVWIGTGAYILPGAAIGDNCVIAANTSVSRRIPSNSLVYNSGPKVIEIRNVSNVI